GHRGGGRSHRRAPRRTDRRGRAPRGAPAASRLLREPGAEAAQGARAASPGATVRRDLEPPGQPGRRLSHAQERGYGVACWEPAARGYGAIDGPGRAPSTEFSTNPSTVRVTSKRASLMPLCPMAMTSLPPRVSCCTRGRISDGAGKVTEIASKGPCSAQPSTPSPWRTWML